MLISTMNDGPGHQVTTVLGEVFGLTAGSRHIGSPFGSAFNSVKGGELRAMAAVVLEPLV